jgi:hypothetical protein
MFYLECCTRILESIEFMQGFIQTALVNIWSEWSLKVMMEHKKGGGGTYLYSEM